MAASSTHVETSLPDVTDIPIDNLLQDDGTVLTHAIRELTEESKSDAGTVPVAAFNSAL
jgi:FXSXX-COOH protein